jgi:hypothetical protein
MWRKGSSDQPVPAMLVKDMGIIVHPVKEVVNKANSLLFDGVIWYRTDGETLFLRIINSYSIYMSVTEDA